MLVPFTLDPEALPCESLGFQDHALHRSILGVWGELGLLVHDGEALWTRIETLPDHLRKAWQQARLRFPQKQQPVMSCLNRASSLRELSALTGTVRVVGVDEKRGVRFGLTPERPSTRVDTTDIEVCVASSLSHSRAVLRNRLLREQPLEPGMSTEAFWKDRFEPLAERSNHVVVFDRYCAVGLLGEWKDHGLPPFLRYLDKKGPERHVQIVAAYQPRNHDPDAVHEAVGKLVQALSGHGVRQVELFLSKDDQDWIDRGHDRYLVFRDAIVTIGAGIGVLGPETISRQTTCVTTSRHVAREGGAEASHAMGIEALDGTFIAGKPSKTYYPQRHQPSADPF